MPDPYNDRMVSIIPLPPNKRLAYDRVFPRDPITNERAYSPNTELIKNYQYDGGLIDKQSFMEIISKATQVLKREPNLLRISGKVVVIGDIHG